VLTVTASGPGAWAERLLVVVSDGTTRKIEWKDGEKDKESPIGYKFRIAYSREPVADAWNPFDDESKDEKVILPKPFLVEEFDDVVLEDEKSPNHYSKRITGNSSLIEVSYKPENGATGRPSIGPDRKTS
jgi:hypothetical protein